ncbi:MAG: hypothetical protein HQL36_03635 [Alphaproteobacteria bacterium]|nr:hypothetical protein [Alphaproteobacteria bacterium]MBF0249924.1 hypothetical protein [Alphaproteobacteria bacterium]
MMTNGARSPMVDGAKQPTGVMDMDDKVEKIAARMEQTFRQAGDTFWKTPAGARAIELLETQDSVTVADLINSFENDKTKDRRIKAMHESVIAHLRDLQERRRSG